MRPSANQLGLPLAVYAERFEASKVVRQVGPNLPEKPKQTVKLEGQVTVARSLAGVERSLRLLRTILIAGGLAVLLVAALLGLGLAAHLLRPLARMRATAQRIGDERDFSHRMPVDGDPPRRARPPVAVVQPDAGRAGAGQPRPQDDPRRPSAASWPTPRTSCGPR